MNQRDTYQHIEQVPLEPGHYANFMQIYTPSS